MNNDQLQGWAWSHTNLVEAYNKMMLMANLIMDDEMREQVGPWATTDDVDEVVNEEVAYLNCGIISYICRHDPQKFEVIDKYFDTFTCYAALAREHYIWAKRFHDKWYKEPQD